jgi:hypothetical protein
VRPENVPPGTATGPDEAPGSPGVPGELGAAGQCFEPGSTRQGPTFISAYEKFGIQCTSYVRDDDDSGFQIFGSKEGDAKDNLATNDVV